MGFEQQLASMNPGSQLAALPIDKMIATLGIGVAKAQAAMDDNAIATAIKLGETFLNLPDPADPDGTISRSLLSLGFLPTFYQFTEATLDLKVEMKYSVEENVQVKVDASASGQAGPVAIAASVGVDYGKKFGIEASMMTQVRLALTAVPPPKPLMDFLSTSFTR